MKKHKPHVTARGHHSTITAPPQPPRFKDPVPASAGHTCDCGQPALWILTLSSGRLSQPSAFYLCDDCLSLELTPPKDQATQ